MSSLTALSGGALIRDVLTDDTELMAYCTKVFPIVGEADAVLPYITYMRTGISQNDIKTHGMNGAFSAYYEVTCYAESYKQSVDMAEKVCQLLDGNQYKYTDEATGAILIARSIQLTSADESWEAGAYAQHLTFQIKL